MKVKEIYPDVTVNGEIKKSLPIFQKGKVVGYVILDDNFVCDFSAIGIDGKEFITINIKEKI